MNTLNRRKFLSSSALLATSSLISVTANAACKDPMPAKWDEEVDVIVVGSGFAGLAAAAEAKNANAGNVIVLEKMRAPGGNSVINGGIFAVPGNPAQVKLGIKDSPELLASDMIAAGLGYGYPEKIKAMTEEALPTYEWTVKELGVQYNDKVGHSVPRHVSAIASPSCGASERKIASHRPLAKSFRAFTFCMINSVFCSRGLLPDGDGIPDRVENHQANRSANNRPDSLLSIRSCSAKISLM